MSSTCWYCLFSRYVQFVILFIYLFALLISIAIIMRWLLWDPPRSSSSMTLSSKRESKASDSWPFWSYVLSLTSSHIGLHALILLPKPHTFRIWVHTWLDMLSHIVLSVIQAFYPLWCLVWLVSLFECYGLPSIKMWVDRLWIDAVVWVMVGMVGMVNTVMACGARIC
jgi:hypothetical protein